ncbi:hypothetical protein PLICRDRAFT_74436, partial [Plicaturopsis crispa FD-325 SS-3]
IVAALDATQHNPPFAPLHIRSDSKYVIDGLTEHLQSWEDRGWIGVSNSEFWRPLVARMRKRSAITTLQWVKGHSNNEGNDGADKQAEEGANKAAPDVVNLNTPAEFNLTGARIATLSQSLAYQGIRTAKTKATMRTSTLVSLDMTRHAAKDISNKLPTDSRIWRSIKSKDIARNIREFLWKCLHNAFRCGKWWQNIPNYEHRSVCPHCGTEESMEHILTECDAPGQTNVWKLARRLWLRKHAHWPAPTYGTIMACGLAEFKDNQDSPRPGAARLYRIIMSESAHLIWRIRCERRISREDDPQQYHSKAEIHNRWLHAINTRLTLDRAMTDRKKYGNKALPSQMVLNTWSGTLMNEDALPDDWIRQTGVL